MSEKERQGGGDEGCERRAMGEEEGGGSLIYRL